MGLGIGANTAIFSIVNGLLFANLPYKNPENIVQVFTQTAESKRLEWVSYPDLVDFRDRTELFSAVAATSDGEPLNIVTEEGSEFAIGEAFSAELFSLLDIPPALGRGFLPHENEPGSDFVGMMSHAVWQRKFGGDPTVIGRTLQINGHPVTIVGVGPEGFNGTLIFINTEYWLSWGTADAIERYIHVDDRSNRNVRMHARLNPGVTLEDAEVQLQTMASNLALEYPETNEEQRAVVMPASDVRIDPGFDKALFPISAFLMTVVGLVLVVACSNLAGLLLIRASSRQKEIAVRLAMGASRTRLMSLLLTESALLGVLGGAVGLLIAFWTASAILSYQPPFPVSLSINFQLDQNVLAFNLLLSIATGILFGLAPALKASRCDLVGTIKDEVPALDMGHRRFTLRNFFVVAQVAVSLVLLIGAGVCIRNLSNWQNVDIGLESEHAALAVVDVGRAGYDTEDKGRAFFERYREALASSPNVDAVAITSRVPFSLWGMDRIQVQRPDVEPDPEADHPEVDYAIVTPEYFSALGVPILRGRNFNTQDTEGSPRAALVSEALAREYWGSDEAIGKGLILGSDEPVQVEIVGVTLDTFVRSIRSAQREPEPFIYMPFSQRYSPVNVLVATTSGDPSTLPEVFRRELHALDYRVPLFESKTMKEHLSIMLYLPRMTVLLFSSFGFVAMVLASIGLYGLVAFSVSQRTREVGIRIALGARAAQVIKMVLKEGMVLVGVGVVLGLVFASLITRPMAGLLMGVAPSDPITFMSVALLLVGVSALAAYIPARRIAKADPMAALRHE
jgi:predicted permease